MSASTKDLLALTEGILSETPSVEKVIVPNHEGKPVEDDGLRDVVVPNAFVNQIVGFNEALNESSDPDKKQEMMPDFKQLLKEARNVMEEMTTTGMIGVNLAPVKKNGSRKRNKRNKSN